MKQHQTAETGRWPVAGEDACPQPDDGRATRQTTNEKRQAVNDVKDYTSFTVLHINTQKGRSNRMNLPINAQELKIRMARLGLSQRGLAEKSGVSRPTLSYAMNGKRVSPVIAGKISAALGCDVAEIVREAESR